MSIFEDLEDFWQTVRGHDDYSRALVTLSTSIGAIVVLFYTFKFMYKLSIAFLLYCLCQISCICRPDYRKKYGQWAVISGSTDGIGLAMARELARRGMSIIVIGRNEEKLSRTKVSLEEEPNAGEIITIKIDLSDSSIENFARIRPLIDPDNRDIGILINNAGTLPSQFRRFNRYPLEDLKQIVNLNILATIYLTRMIMPGMIDRCKGIVVNVSSTFGSVPGPWVSLYSATKTFINAFSRQLQIEYSAHPVQIVNLTPGAVHTKLLLNSTSRISNPTIVNPSPEDYARTSLNALHSGVKQYSGTLIHGLTREIGHLIVSLGLLPIAFKTHLRLMAKDVEFSPVMKRKARSGNEVRLDGDKINSEQQEN